jgi:hypothetical protein
MGPHAPLEPRTLQTLAKTFELTPIDTLLDVEVLQAMPWSGLDALIWLCRCHGWHGVRAVQCTASAPCST